MTKQNESPVIVDQKPAETPEPVAIETAETVAAVTAEPAATEDGLFQKLLFAVSLPERAVRSTSAILGGTIQEASVYLVPQAFRSSRSYTVFIQQSLDLLLEHVGNVQRPVPAGTDPAANDGLLARKTVGSFLDFAGLATLHLSPLTMLALVSDIAYGSSTYLKELSDELKKAGVISEETTIDHAADLLEAVRHASTVSSQAFDVPPLSAEGMKETIGQTVDAVRQVDPTKILPQAEIKQMWDSIREIAGREGLSPFEVSSTLALYSLNKVGTIGQGALSSARVAGNLFDRHIFDHYRSGLEIIRSRGLLPLLAENYRPYVDAVWTNFSSSKSTITEDLLTGRLVGKAWNIVTGFWPRRNTPGSTGG